MNTLPLPTCGAPVIPVWLPSHTGDSQACCPDAASIATRRQSPVPTYTLPAQTASPRFERADQEFRIRSSRTLGSNFHSTFPESSIDRVHARLRHADVDHAVHHDRLRRQPHRALDVGGPGQAQLSDVLVGDLLQRTEMLLVESAPAHQPVGAGGFLGDHSLTQ